MANYKTAYPYFVEYEENGLVSSDHWSAETLATELMRNEVKIRYVQHVDTFPEDD